MRLFVFIGVPFVLLLSVLLLLGGGRMPTVQAQAVDATSDRYLFLPLIRLPAPTPTPTPTPPWATQTKTRSGIHLGNRSTDWRAQNHQYTFLNQIGRTGTGVWPAAVVVLSDQVYSLHRVDTLCQVSGATVKQSDGQAYELFRYLTEGVRHHHLKVVIRLLARQLQRLCQSWPQSSLADHRSAAQWSRLLWR